MQNAGRKIIWSLCRRRGDRGRTDGVRGGGRDGVKWKRERDGDREREDSNNDKQVNRILCVEKDRGGGRERARDEEGMTG